MENIIITLIICGTFAYLGYLGHTESKEQEKKEPQKAFVTIDEALEMAKKEKETKGGKR